MCPASGLYANRGGKFEIWRWLLDEFDFAGDERVLDIGCGRGAVLMLVAHRLPRGQAVGVDLWRRLDHSGNAAAATRANAVREGVADRVELCTADMRALPFADGSFDLVVSSLAVHNVPDRDTVVAEAVRVLRPGGRLVIADIRATRRYREQLSAPGMVAVTRRHLGWRMWWSGPWLSTHVVGAATSYLPRPAAPLALRVGRASGTSPRRRRFRVDLVDDDRHPERRCQSSSSPTEGVPS